MTISMYKASVPMFERQLTGMLSWLEKAETHAKARGFDSVNYLQLRLAPDMLPLVSQVRITSDTAKGCVARLAGMEPPKFEDNEANMADLIARVQKTLDYVREAQPEAIDGSEQREIVIPMRTRDALKFSGEFYLRHFALPNFFFHASMTYALLRHGGVVLGKADFLALE